MMENMTKASTGANLTIDVENVCFKLGIPYIPDVAELYYSELLDTLIKQDKCKDCKKSVAQSIDCYYSVASVDDCNHYRISYSICPKAKQFFKQQKINALIEKGGIGERFKTKTFTNFNVTSKTKSAFDMCVDFVKKYKAHNRGLRLWGNYGCGKTHLVSAIMNNLVAKGEPCMFVVVPELMDYIRQGIKNAEKASTATELIEAAKKVDVLILDDLGAEKTSDWVKEQLFILINARYEKQLTTIVTTNYPLTKLIEQLGQRIISRIVEMTIPVALEYVEDYRLKIAKRIEA